MNTDPIDIRIADNWRYGEIAFLVDREDFLKDLALVRKKLGVKQLRPYKTTKYVEINDLINSRNFDDKLTHTVEELRKKYKKTQAFHLVIKSAILTGVVTEKEYASAYSTIIFPEDDDFFLQSEPNIAIIISPDAKIEDITKVFNKEIPQTKKLYIQKILKSKRVLPDTISNVKRDRQWYWQKKNSSYGKVHKEIIKSQSITRDGIIKAIKQYEARLSVEL